jgi:hypothetical protein
MAFLPFIIASLSSVHPVIHCSFFLFFFVLNQASLFRLEFIMLTTVSTLLLAFGLAVAAPTRNLLTPRVAGSCNTATDRACWTDDFDIDTDYETVTPTGVTRTYEWTVSEFDNWVGPDGVVKPYARLVNGQFPGPTLYAQWGDDIEVTITNNISTSG